MQVFNGSLARELRETEAGPGGPGSASWDTHVGKGVLRDGSEGWRTYSEHLARTVALRGHKHDENLSSPAGGPHVVNSGVWLQCPTL